MRSLRAKLILPFFLGMLTLTLLLAWYTYTSARKAVDDTMLLIAEARTEQAAGSMALLFKSLAGNLQNMATDPHIVRIFSAGESSETLRNSAAEWFDIVTQGNDYYRDLFVVDKAGVCMASSNPGLIGNDYSHLPYVQKALGGQFTSSELSIGRVTKKLSVTMAGPVDSEKGILGALVLVSDFPKIVDYAPGTNPNSQIIFTSMLTPEGLFAAHKDMELMGNKNRLFPDLYKKLQPAGAKGARVEYTLEGEHWVGFAKLDPTEKWLIITSGKTAEVFAPAYQVGFVVLGISLAFFIAVSLAVLRVTGGILDSLFSLIRYAKEVSEGALNTEPQTAKRNDELGVLHSALRTMVASMKAMIDKTEAAARMKGEFLANMSHEIRTPLNAIIGMTHLSLREGDIPPKQRGYLDKIQLAAKSLLGVINDILDLSKVEAGMLAIERRPLSLADTARNSVSIHQQTADEKKLALTLSCDPKLDGQFMGDALRIGQVLNNLVSNALKFTQEGSVRVSIVCGEETEEGEVTAYVSVADSGIGMDEATLANLFQPFSQADASITRRFGGTGLGLAISHRLVSLMGGAFTVKAEPGKGTTFTFSLPLERAAEAPAAAAESEESEETLENLNLEGKRILVAEDNQINRFLLQELLSPTKAALIMAENGQEAVNALKTEQVDIVLMDLQMPVMGGMEATRIIRQNPAHAGLPLIAVTANALEDEKKQGLEGGMNDYITKPIEPKELHRVLKQWMRV